MHQIMTSRAPARRRRSRLLVGAVGAVLVFALACAAGETEDARSESERAADKAAAEAAEDATTPAPAPATACRDTADDVDLDTKRQDLYPGRPDGQVDDHEAAVGDCVRIAGVTAVVDGAAMAESQFGDPQLVVKVTERNRDDRAKPYNMFDWRIQTADGQVLDPGIPWQTERGLSSGDLVSGGTVTGDVAFDVAPGTYFVIWKPDPFDAARGVWQVTVE
jgi:hypothetical protein